MRFQRVSTFNCTNPVWEKKPEGFELLVPGHCVFAPPIFEPSRGRGPTGVSIAGLFRISATILLDVESQLEECLNPSQERLGRCTLSDQPFQLISLIHLSVFQGLNGLVQQACDQAFLCFEKRHPNRLLDVRLCLDGWWSVGLFGSDWSRCCRWNESAPADLVSGFCLE